MKKLIFGLFAISMLFACSSDSDGGDPFNSTLKVNGANFVPDEEMNMPNNKVTYYQETGGVNSRSFNLMRTNANGSVELLNLGIVYPADQGSINGTYPVEAPGVLGNNFHVTGLYLNSEAGFNFKTGSVTIHDLGHNRFKIAFNNVVSRDYNNNFTPKTITGSANGIYTLGEDVLVD